MADVEQGPVDLLGIRVEKSITAANGVVNAFTIAGGLIQITSLIGIVTTQIGATVATLKLQSDPTATGSTVDLCAAVAVTGDIIGHLYSISGTAGDNIQIGSIGAVRGMDSPVYVPIGTIENVFSADPVGGVIRWVLHYLPVDSDATVVAA